MLCLSPPPCDDSHNPLGVCTPCGDARSPCLNDQLACLSLTLCKPRSNLVEAFAVNLHRGPCESTREFIFGTNGNKAKGYMSIFNLMWDDSTARLIDPYDPASGKVAIPTSRPSR